MFANGLHHVAAILPLSCWRRVGEFFYFQMLDIRDIIGNIVFFTDVSYGVSSVFPNIFAFVPASWIAFI